MLIKTDLPLEEKLLRQFLKEGDLNKLSTPEENKAFQELQYYNLIKITAEGRVKITPKGEGALEVGVRAYLVNQRFQEKLINDSLRGKEENPIFTIAFVFLLLLIGAMLGMIISSLFSPV